MARRKFEEAADFFTLAARAARGDLPGAAIEHGMKALDLVREGVTIASGVQDEPKPTAGA
jgi:hypothetical protein